ncbi:hypothetical protein DFH06DRAFT_1125329 [Mycena polygramma]|nr:hypothetical protein DFH06DRAFT_1125329 [Mycena polygramma]
MSKYVTFLRAHEHLTLACAEYGEDFMATRHQTLGDRSLFTFKDVKGGEYTRIRSGLIVWMEYTPYIIGKMLEVKAEENACELRVCLGSPHNFACDIQALYAAQMEVLTNIVEADNEGAETVDSWIPSPNIFWVTMHADDERELAALLSHLEGAELVQVMVALQRLDSADGTHKTYQIEAKQITTLLDGLNVPRIDTNYACNVSPVGCKWCWK